MACYYIGVMSGTSVDAVDTVLCDIDPTGQVKHLLTYSLAFPAELKNRLHSAMTSELDSLISLKQLEADYSHQVVSAVHGLLKQASIAAEDVNAIGCHGQTLWHQPPSKTSPEASAFSFQLVNASLIAVKTRIDVIYDFRQKDILAGGEGAPLVPAFHYHIFAPNCAQHTAILNLGGIANITYLGASKDDVIGFDSGPANTVIDAYFRHIWGSLGYDNNGNKARSGCVIESLLKALMSAPYFSRRPPKSTGVEEFNLGWLDNHLNGSERPEDVLRTLIEVSAQSIAEAMTFLPSQPQQIVACGGGVCNPLLVERIAAQVAPAKLTTTASYQLDPQAVEALAFAWLAWCYEQKKPGNLCAVTGASHPVILGSKVYFN